MKKLILLLMCTCLLLSGCSVFPQTTGEVDENSVLTPSVASTEEGDDMLKATVKVFEFDGKTVSARYLKTGQRSTGGYYDEYEDDAGTVYTFDIDGNLIGYNTLLSTETPKIATRFSGDEMNMERAAEIAADYAKEFCGADFEKFKLQNKHQSGTGRYSFQFCAIYKDFILGEICIVALNEDGSLQSIQRTGASEYKGFDAALLDNISETNILENCVKLAKEQYGDKYVGVTVDSVTVNKEKEKFVLNVSFVAEFYIDIDTETYTAGMTTQMTLE